ncbi:hypothetical protein N9K06_00670 [Omnitrophica bacterium]|nr:hypothetical protein [Candidatus Omnitrophota bacterium]
MKRAVLRAARFFFFGSCLRTAESEDSMQEDRKEQELTRNHESKAKTRSRRITADFMRVEDAGTMPALTPFERETRKEIAAQSRTPLDDLAARETQRERLIMFKAGKRKIHELIGQGALTRRQRLVYELSFISRLEDIEIAELLEISRGTVRRLRQKIRLAFVRALKQHRRKQSLIGRAAFVSLTHRQKQVFKLHYRQGIEPNEIAAKLGFSERHVYYVLKRIQKKLFTG